MFDLRVLTGTANPKLAQAVADQLGVRLSETLVSRFADGEIRVQVQESVRGMDVFVIQPTCPPTSENIIELLIILDALKRASARRITAIIPYYGYARQEKKVKPREPIAARLMADLIATAGATRVLLVDVHVQTIQGFFNLPVDHLPAGPLFAQYFRERGLGDGNTVVVSPDVGGVGRASSFADRLGATLAIIAKRRPEPNECEIIDVIGDVDGKRAIMVDDMVDTAGSLVSGAKALINRGATAVYACASHGLLSGPAIARLQESPIEKLLITDTIPLADEKRIPRVDVLSVAPMLAEAIRRIHSELSLSTIFEKFWVDDSR
ncbi:MAG TPA: ribose-phosphate pyrophosphokinase [Armatimonadota bacterium]|nr:ribose-phosphate pyrophosphokinase [Armatimonadota bacterium]